jgi:excisionase family DNA binding protein
VSEPHGDLRHEPPDRWPTALLQEEVAEVLFVSLRQVQRLIRRGELPVVQLGRKRRILKETLLKYLQQREMKPSSPRRTPPIGRAHLRRTR